MNRVRLAANAPADQHHALPSPAPRSGERELHRSNLWISRRGHTFEVESLRCCRCESSYTCEVVLDMSHKTGAYGPELRSGQCQ
jgi:hypothetical protein